MNEFKTTESGIVVPAESTAAKEDNTPKVAWSFSMCDERYFKSENLDFRKAALESLYIAVDPGGGGIPNDPVASKERKARLLAILNELSTELVGGVPSYEHYT